jgi:hypothetical protein
VEPLSVALADRLGTGSRFHRAAPALALLELAPGRGEPAIDQLD